MGTLTLSLIAFLKSRVMSSHGGKGVASIRGRLRFPHASRLRYPTEEFYGSLKNESDVRPRRLILCPVTFFIIVTFPHNATD